MPDLSAIGLNTLVVRHIDRGWQQLSAIRAELVDYSLYHRILVPHGRNEGTGTILRDGGIKI